MNPSNVRPQGRTRQSGGLFGHSAPGGGSGTQPYSVLLQEDGVFYFDLEDNTGVIEMEAP